jgi:hypothetical protein
VSIIENRLRAVARCACAMQIRAWGIAALAAGIAGLAGAAGTATASSPQTVTLGSTTGTPTQNICVAGVNCTYVPFSGAAAPELQVPFDGTVTSFSVNAGSTGGTVELRVLRPAGGGQFTGAGTSPTETLSNTGVNTFTVSLPVKAGDVLGLDNSTSALMFDTNTATAITAYYQPSLADGSTAAPNVNRSGYRLLLSATVQENSTTTTSTTTTSTPPVVSSAHQSHRTWREGSRLAAFSRKRRPPVGTTFSFVLNEPAKVSFTFVSELKGRRVDGKCKAQSKTNRSKPACRRSVPRGTLSFSGHAGVNQVKFQGRLAAAKKLAPGSYTALITATNAALQRSNTAALSFTIVK